MPAIVQTQDDAKQESNGRKGQACDEEQILSTAWSDDAFATTSPLQPGLAELEARGRVLLDVLQGELLVSVTASAVVSTPICPAAQPQPINPRTVQNSGGSRIRSSSRCRASRRTMRSGATSTSQRQERARDATPPAWAGLRSRPPTARAASPESVHAPRIVG